LEHDVMPNITKYMGKAIPGMSVIQGAWDAGQGVSSLIKGLQRLAAKQSGGPVPMEDIQKWMDNNRVILEPRKTRKIDKEVRDALRDVDYLGFENVGEALANIKHHPDWEERWDLQDDPDVLKTIKKHLSKKAEYPESYKNQNFYVDRGELKTDRYLGFMEKDDWSQIKGFMGQNKKWDTDVKFLVQALQELQNIKEESKGKRRGSKYGHYNVGGGKPYFEDLIWDEQGKIDTILEAYTGGERQHTGFGYIEPGSRGTTRNVSKARDSIWMSVLDAMKKREKQEKKKK
jgi:hypothetical protein